MTLSQTQREIEAILFASGEPVEAERIAQATGVDEETVRRLITELQDRLEEEESPLTILKLDGQYQLGTRPQYAGVIQQALSIKRNAPLSQAALEVLAVVAYNQPVTRGFVEQVRGVDSSGVISSLVEKGLIEEAGRLELPGRPIAYATTRNFLRCFSLESLAELPRLPDRAADSDEDALEGQIGFSDAVNEEGPQ